MRMSIFVFTLAVLLAAGSAYSEMIAMNESSRPIAGISDVSTDHESKGLGDIGKDVDGIAPVRVSQGY